MNPLSPWLDRFGVAAAAVCVLHCLLAPIALLALPLLDGWWDHPLSHIAVGLLTVPVAGFALWRGFAKHRRQIVLIAGAVGMFLVSLGAVLPWASTPVMASEVAVEEAVDGCCPRAEIDETTGEWDLSIPPGSWVSLLGGAALLFAHTRNLACCNSCGKGS